jgi:hypothetical protein
MIEEEADVEVKDAYRMLHATFPLETHLRSCHHPALAGRIDRAPDDAQATRGRAAAEQSTAPLNGYRQTN